MMKKSLYKLIGAIVLICLLSGCSETAMQNTYRNHSSGSSIQESRQSTVSSDQTASETADTQSETNEQGKTPGVPAKVVKVIDGDTFEAVYQKEVTTVRVLLIDTPETHHPKLGVQPFGPEAAAYARQLLEGKTVKLEVAVGGGRDKYGRLLAYIYVNGKSFAQLQLERGLARVAYIYPPNTKYVDQYRDSEAKAKKKRLGIWSVDGYARADGYHPEMIKGTGAGGAVRSQTNASQSAVSGGSFNPDGAGGCSGAIKGNISGRGKIYHMPSDPYYKKTKAEICFKSRQSASAAGFRSAK